MNILIARTKDVNWDRKDLVVETAREDSHHSHEEVEVAELSECWWSKEQADGEEEMDHSVAHVSEHDAKLDWECHDCEQSRVNFLVSWNTIGLNQQLRRVRKIIKLEVRRRHLAPPVLDLLQIALAKIRPDRC